MDARQARFDALDKIETDYNYRQNLQNNLTALNTDVTNLENDLLAMPDPLTNQFEVLTAEQKRQQLIQKQQEIQQKTAEINNINNQYTSAGLTLDAEHTRIHTPTPPATQDLYSLSRMKLNNAQTAYNTQKQDNDNLRQKIDEYETATENINTAQRQKDELQRAANEWDDKNKNEYLELMAYWDFLQSGKTKSLFHISTKKLQNKMNSGQMQTMLQDWNRQYAA